MPQQFDIKRKDARLEIRLRGTFEEADGRALEQAVQTELARGPESPRHALVYASELTECSILGRASLINMQEALAKSRTRTAWLSDKPRFRGLGLLVVHSANDEGAKVVATPAQADEWLTSAGGRIERTTSAARSALADVRKRVRSAQ